MRQIGRVIRLPDSGHWRLTATGPDLSLLSTSSENQQAQTHRSIAGNVNWSAWRLRWTAEIQGNETATDVANASQRDFPN